MAVPTDLNTVMSSAFWRPLALPRQRPARSPRTLSFRITFRRFLKYGLPVTVVNLILSTLYLWLRFLR